MCRVQNKELYVQYQAHKRRVERELETGRGFEHARIEESLWHGTRSDAVQSICSQEFNRSFSGLNGMVYTTV